jgi:hypothetical protein
MLSNLLFCSPLTSRPTLADSCCFHDVLQSKGGDDRGMLVEISRQADNLHWLVDILIDRRIADDFVRMWAHQAELATLHMQVPVMFRYEVSRLTARLCIAIGKGQVRFKSLSCMPLST